MTGLDLVTIGSDDAVDRLFTHDHDNLGPRGHNRWVDLGDASSVQPPFVRFRDGYFVDAGSLARSVADGHTLDELLESMPSVREFEASRLPDYRGTMTLANLGTTVGVNSAAQVEALVGLDLAGDLTFVGAESIEVYGFDNAGEPITAIPHYLIRRGGRFIALDVYPIDDWTPYVLEKQDLLAEVLTPLGIQVAMVFQRGELSNHPPHRIGLTG